MVSEDELESNSEPQYGGWPQELLEIDLPEVFQRQLECPVCMMVVKDAVQCANQHGFCETCWRLTKACPLCKSKKDAIPAQILRQMVDKLTIRCGGEGCNFKTYVESIESHRSTCPLVLVSCPNKGCFARVMRKDLKHHISVECNHQLVQCGQCGAKILRSAVSNHSCLEHVLKITAELYSRNQALAQRNENLERQMAAGEQEKASLLSMIAMLRVDPTISALVSGGGPTFASGAPSAPPAGTATSAQDRSSANCRKRKKNDLEDMQVEFLSDIQPPGTHSERSQVVASATVACETPSEISDTQGMETESGGAPAKDLLTVQISNKTPATTSVTSPSMSLPSTNISAVLSRIGQAPLHDPNSYLFVIGGYDGLTGLSSMERYNGTGWRMQEVRGTPLHKRSDFACAILDGVAYIAGGRLARAHLNVVEGWDGVSTRQFPKMSSKRAYFGFCALNGKLYAAGGNAGRHDLNTVECFDPQTQRWTAVQRMNSKRSGLALAALGGALYAVGGAVATTALNSCERFTPQDGWSFTASMLVPRTGTGVAVFRNEIYAIGGVSDDGTFLTTVEKFDGEKWVMVAPLITQRSTPAVAVFQDSIYVIGGYNNVVGLLESVERFDGFSWTPAHPISMRRNAASAFSLTLPSNRQLEL